MAKIINLRQARKQRQRERDRQGAEERSVRYGLPEVVRRLERLRRDRDAAKLDGKKLES